MWQRNKRQGRNFNEVLKTFSLDKIDLVKKFNLETRKRKSLLEISGSKLQLSYF